MRLALYKPAPKRSIRGCNIAVWRGVWAESPIEQRMPGKLAGLFAGKAPSQERAANSKLPVGPSRPASASGILEQLRAVNDPDTVLQGELHACATLLLDNTDLTGVLDSRQAAGLHNLRQRLQDRDADSLRVELILSKHGHEALGTVWKSQGLVGSKS